MDLAALHLPERFRQKIDHDLVYLLHYPHIQIEQIILFGSCARGTWKVTSDVDLLVITSESLDRYTRGDIASELDEEIEGVRTDCVFYTMTVFETSDSLLIRQIKSDGIALYTREKNHEGGYYEYQ